MSDRRLTVCQLLFSLNRGGAEVLAARLARRLSERYRFVFACLDEAGSMAPGLRDEGFPVHVLDRRPGVDFACARRLAALARDERVGVMHAHQYSPFLYAGLSRWPRRRPPVLFTEHGRAFPDLTGWSHKPVNRLLLRGGDRVVGVGRAVRQVLIDKEGLPAGRVGVIYNGIDTQAYANPGSRAEVRRELGLGPDDFVAIFVARLDPIKDHATALRALARVAAVRDDAKMVVAGEGPASDAVAAEVARLGLGGRVVVAGVRADVARLLGGADVSVLTSLSEGIPLSLIEAMAAGLPVVATRVGGVPEVVEDGVTGLLAPSGDDAGVAEALLRLAADPGLRAGLGRRGRARAEAVFSEAQMHASYCEAYDAMAPRPPG